jgi:pilus assembly protein CpaF
MNEPESPSHSPTVAGWTKTPPIQPPEPRSEPVKLPTVPSSSYAERKQQLHSRLVEQLNLPLASGVHLENRREELRAAIEQLIDLHPVPTPLVERSRLVQELLDDILGLGPLEPLLKDPTISDILVNGPSEVYIDRRGKLELTEVRFRDTDHLLQVLDRIVSRVGRRIDESSPLVDARLTDGSRVNAVIPPLSLRGPLISIRRFGAKPLVMEDLLRFKMLTPEMQRFLEAAVHGRLNVIISGGTGSGKTTLLNALSRYIPATERIITIEDAAELKLQQRHVLPLETRPPNIEGKGQITTRDLVRNALRMRPDRIVVGECRGGEALDMLQAMNTGHDGSLTTLHANSPRDALNRLETMVLMAGFDLPLKAIRQQIAGALDLIVQVTRLEGGVRKITQISEVLNLEGDTILTQDIFSYQQEGLTIDGVAYGQFLCTGVRPACLRALHASNINFPPEFFSQRILLTDR